MPRLTLCAAKARRGAPYRAGRLSDAVVRGVQHSVRVAAWESQIRSTPKIVDATKTETLPIEKIRI